MKVNQTSHHGRSSWHLEACTLHEQHGQPVFVLTPVRKANSKRLRHACRAMTLAATQLQGKRRGVYLHSARTVVARPSSTGPCSSNVQCEDSQDNEWRAISPFYLESMLIMLNAFTTRRMTTARRDDYSLIILRSTRSNTRIYAAISR